MRHTKSKVKHYEYHPYANIFPLLNEDSEEFEALVSDIKTHGLQIPIILTQHDGEWKILDGRNRYRACIVAKFQIKTANYEGNDPLGYVISLNLQRRHLNSTQKSTLTVNVIPMLKAEAKLRQATSTGGSNPQLTQKIAEGGQGEAVEKAAKLFGTNRDYVRKANRLSTEAPDLFERCRLGELSIPDAMTDMKSRTTGSAIFNTEEAYWDAVNKLLDFAREGHYPVVGVRTSILKMGKKHTKAFSELKNLYKEAPEDDTKTPA